MRQHYQKRTNHHISLVQKYMRKTAGTFQQFSALIERQQKHDKSKFKQPEMTPYIFITWKYKMKDEGKQFTVPKQIQDQMHQATQHHVLNNSHHPEYLCGKKSGVINRDNRDKPKQLIDGTKMPRIDIAQMCCDWCAVSQQKGGTPKKWAQNNINIRWKFTKQQQQLIYQILQQIWQN